MKKLTDILRNLMGIRPETPAPSASAKNPMPALRAKALSLTAADVGITREKFSKEVFGVVMETGFDGGAHSLVALADGTTSLYISSGGGVIGGGGQAAVRKASGNLIAGGNHFLADLRPVASTENIPYPAKGEVNFYFLSFGGLLGYSASERDLKSEKDKLASLFAAGHHVIAAMREAEAAQKKQSAKPASPS